MSKSKFVGAFAGMALLAGCGGSDGSTTSTPETTGQGMSWEQFLSVVYQEPDTGIFIADGDTQGFLASRLGRAEGDIVDETGAKVGTHEGAYGFTIGQRKGLRIGHPAPDGKPLPLERNVPAGLNSWTVLRGGDGHLVIHVAAGAQPGNWLAIAPEQPFRLVLTLLDTPTAGSSGVIDLSMPAITRTGCTNA